MAQWSNVRSAAYAPVVMEETFFNLVLLLKMLKYVLALKQISISSTNATARAVRAAMEAREKVKPSFAYESTNCWNLYHLLNF